MKRSLTPSRDFGPQGDLWVGQEKNTFHFSTSIKNKWTTSTFWLLVVIIETMHNWSEFLFNYSNRDETKPPSKSVIAWNRLNIQQLDKQPINLPQGHCYSNLKPAVRSSTVTETPSILHEEWNMVEVHLVKPPQKEKNQQESQKTVYKLQSNMLKQPFRTNRINLNVFLSLRKAFDAPQR